MINSDYHPVELGLAKPVIYTRLSHLVHTGKHSEMRTIQGAKQRPPGWLRTGGDGEGRRASPVFLVFTPKCCGQSYYA